MRIADYVAALNLDTRKAEGKLRKFDGEARRSSKQSVGLIAKNRAALASLAAVAIPAAVIGGLVALVRNASKLETALVGVQKTTGLTDIEINRLKLSIFKLGAELPVSINNLLEISKVAGQLGIVGAADIAKFTEAFAKLEIASDRTISGELGAQSFARFLANTDEAIKNADKVGSAFTLLGNESKLTEGQLLATALEISKIARTYKLSADEVLGLATTFTELSIQPEVARTVLTRFFRAVEVGVTDGKGLPELRKVTKLTTDEIRTLAKEDPAKIFIKFARGIQEARDAGKNINKELKALGLGGTIAATAISAVSAQADNLEKKIADSSRAYTENVALNEESALASKTFSAELTKLGNSFVNLGDAIAGTGLLSALSAIVSTTGDVITVLSHAIRLAKELFDINIIKTADEARSGLSENQLLAQRRTNIAAGKGLSITQIRELIARGGQAIESGEFVGELEKRGLFEGTDLGGLLREARAKKRAQQISDSASAINGVGLQGAQGAQTEVNISNDIKVEAPNPSQAGNEISRITQADIALGQGT